jgi:hypothetical protein
MSFEAAWGFDPEKAIQAQSLLASRLETDKSSYSAEEQRAARIPADLLAQVYELRRMYRL